jgi:dTDP-4-amino-4,6-dideoxygalactose transaminase
MQKAVDTVEEFWNKKDINELKDKVSDRSIPLFKQELSDYLGVESKSVYFQPSARKGLEMLLKSIKDEKKTVLVPAFNCPVVEDAILKAGWEVRLYDFSSKIGVFDWDKLLAELDNHIGVIIVTHYFGVPVNFLKIKEKCNEMDILIIEDCAHTLGGRIDDLMAGTIGDASIFSFNYDKPISLGWGGFVLINNQNKFNVIDDSEWCIPSLRCELDFLYDFILSMSNRRRAIPLKRFTIFKIINKFDLFKYFFQQEFIIDENISIGALQAELGRYCLKRYSKVLEKRNTNSELVSKEINTLSWPVGKDVQPAWLKQKVFINNVKSVYRISKYMQSNMYRIGNFNWPKLLNCNNKFDFKKSEIAAELWIDMPIHQNMDKKSVVNYCSKVNSFL